MSHHNHLNNQPTELRASSPEARYGSIDLDNFDQHEYFPAWAGGHCCAIALGLHRLTGWRLVVLFYDLRYWVHPMYAPTGHACVMTPGGKLLDRKGFFTAEEFADGDGQDECDVELISAAMLEAEYLNCDDFNNAVTEEEDYGGADPHKNLELAIPLARVLLDRYCSGHSFIPGQMLLFGSQWSDAPILDADNLPAPQSWQAA